MSSLSSFRPPSPPSPSSCPANLLVDICDRELAATARVPPVSPAVNVVCPVFASTAPSSSLPAVCPARSLRRRLATNPTRSLRARTLHHLLRL
ncbi:hypothetical protein PLICRDRAFT_698349 [Plicaturopsis crispa FD-325 SS-3]|nr:hypothetical protein PLICRDRAFT_698349 [Plicaturopsis crispa FD-325 SS-3]